MRYFALAILILLSAHPAYAEYGVYSGLHFGFGEEGNQSEDPNQARTMGTIDLQALPGIKLYGKSLLVGLLFDFRILSQLSSGDTNSIGDFGGQGLLLGPGAALDFSFGKLLVSYDMRARQSISSPDGTFKGSGFHFLFGYKAMPSFSIDLEYVITRYNTFSGPLRETDLSAKPVKHNNLGFGASLIF